MEIPMMEILDIKDNYVIDRTQEAGCSSNYLIPCTTLNLYRLEGVFLAKSLVKRQATSVLNSKMFETIFSALESILQVADLLFYVLLQ
jgi:hypothetical protein